MGKVEKRRGGEEQKERKKSIRGEQKERRKEDRGEGDWKEERWERNRRKSIV